MPWDLKGNSGTNPTTDCLGTLDPQPLVIKTNGAERMRITADRAITMRGDLTVGAGANGALNVRHINGKHWENDTDDGLFLNFNTGHDVHIGSDEKASTLVVKGDLRWGNSVANRDSIELGSDGTTPGVGTPYIDFHFRGLTQDFNTRIMNDADGRLTVVAYTLQVQGNVGIGTATPVSPLHLHGNSPNFALTFTNEANSPGKRGYRIAFDNDRLSFQRAEDTGGYVVNHVAIAHDTGNVGIGTTSPGAKLEVAGEIRAQDVILSSDARLKTAIAPITGALEKLRQLRGVAFAWHDPDGSTTPPVQRRALGLIAQEVEPVFPELVDARDPEGYKGVHYSGLLGVLVEAAKELAAEHQALRQRVEALVRDRASNT